MKKILVTGGSGFIGTHIVNRLVSDGHAVTILQRKKNISNNKAETKILDLTTYNPVKQGTAAGFDVIMHLAGTVNVNELIKNPSQNIMNNIISTLNLLEDIRLNNPQCHLIFASSEKVYGSPASEGVDENTPCWPKDPYGASKLMSETAIISYHHTYGTRFTILRSGNTFGPGQPAGLFIPSVITQIVQGKDTLKLGSLEAYRNFVFVEDAVEAYVHAIEKEGALNNIFNISSYNLRIQEVLEDILDIAKEEKGRKIKVIKDETLVRKSESGARRSVLDCSRAEKILGWKTNLTFDEAIKRTFLTYF